MSQARELDPTRETERAEQSPPDLVLADCVAKVFLDHSTNFPSFLARRSNAAARPPCKAARSRQAGLRHDGRIEGPFFAPLARVLSFIADNRDTQKSMMWRLGSPAIKGGATTQALSASSL
jgi:hypothetical protein